MDNYDLKADVRTKQLIVINIIGRWKYDLFTRLLYGVTLNFTNKYWYISTKTSTLHNYLLIYEKALIL